MKTAVANGKICDSRFILIEFFKETLIKSFVHIV